MTTAINISSLNGAKFNELDSSELLAVGNGVTINGNGTYTVTADNNGNLATYDTWSGSLGQPDPSDILFYQTTVVSSTPDTPYGVVKFTFTTGNNTVNPTSGFLGAEVIAWNSTEVLLEIGDNFNPNESSFTPSGNFIVFGLNDISTYDGSFGSGQSITFGTTGPFPALCFLAGTAIATPAGERDVQDLMEGDLVLTASGVARPIVWVGKGEVLVQRYRRTAATPVIIRKNAFADNIPDRDLRVTKGHSFLFDGVLIPAEFLINHRSILWDDHVSREISVYHIELEAHDLLLANGAVAESYRDDGNRWLFRNANAGWSQPPKSPCAPVLTDGPIVDAVWRRLLDRAGPRPGQPLTNDPDLHLVLDGQRIDGTRTAHGVYLFHMPPLKSPGIVRIRSRANAPDELGWSRDPRVLGVALHRLVATSGKTCRVIDAADASLTHGFHAYEPLEEIRWTNGDAELPGACFEGFNGNDVTVQIYLKGETRYVESAPIARAA